MYILRRILLVHLFYIFLSTSSSTIFCMVLIGFTNPNNCPAVGTFYVQSTNTDFTIVKELSDLGFEIGITTADGTVPQSEADWRTSVTGTTIPVTQP